MAVEMLEVEAAAQEATWPTCFATVGEPKLKMPPLQLT